MSENRLETWGAYVKAFLTRIGWDKVKGVRPQTEIYLKARALMAENAARLQPFRLQEVQAIGIDGATVFARVTRHTKENMMFVERGVDPKTVYSAMRGCKRVNGSYIRDPLAVLRSFHEGWSPTPRHNPHSRRPESELRILTVSRHLSQKMWRAMAAGK